MDIRTLLTYSDNTRELLRQTLGASPEVFDRQFETLAPYKSIRQLTAHIIGAEERWIVLRLNGQPIEKSYEQRAALTIEDMFEDWAQIRANTHVVLQSLDADGLARLVPVSLPHLNLETEMTVEQIYFHLFNHQTFHVGQISMALQQFQIDPPYFDYVLWK